MEREFTIDEIKNDVFALSRDEAPGPDGFSMFFYQEFWKTIKDNLFAFFSKFYQNEKIPKGINATFLTLIPKKVGASFVNDFRPISLIFVLTEYLSKFFRIE